MTEILRTIKKCTCCGKLNNLCHLDIQDLKVTHCIRNKEMIAVWFSCVDCGSTMLSPMSKSLEKQLENFTKGECLNETCGKCKK